MAQLPRLLVVMAVRAPNPEGDAVLLLVRVLLEHQDTGATTCWFLGDPVPRQTGRSRMMMRSGQAARRVWRAI